MWKLSVGQSGDDLILYSGNEFKSSVAAAMVINGQTVRDARTLAAHAWNMVADEGELWSVELRDGRILKVEAA